MPARLTSAPTIHTPRLELRAHRVDDLAGCEQLWTDPVVTRHTTGRPLTRQEVWTRLLRHPGHWALLGFGYWLACERTSGRLVGEVGVAQFQRDVMQAQPELNALPEAGWVTLPWAHGQGFASEAMAAVMAWRDDHLPVPRTFCLIHPENAPSLRLAAKLGFVPELELDDGTVVLLRSSQPGQHPPGV